jgi:hypothetical protein
MADRPILFSAPMVRALLAGTKTQTRRVVKPQPDIVRLEPITAEITSGFVAKKTPEDERHGRLGKIIRCPHGLPGDRLWVREAWSGDKHRVDYRADGESRHDRMVGGWRPSIHMPRWASRITLEVTGVRVERLQDISEADAKAEGVKPREVRQFWLYGASAEKRAQPYRQAAVDPYRELWESINGAGSWNANPWVWVVEFKMAA